MVKPKSHNVPTDPNQLAAYIVAETAHIAPDKLAGKNLLAVMFGSHGGRKGGPARARALSPKERTDCARKAAKTRWRKHRAQSELAKPC